MIIEVYIIIFLFIKIIFGIEKLFLFVLLELLVVVYNDLNDKL